MAEKHWMIDLESFGTEMDSMIVSIGYTRFNKKGISDKGEFIIHLPSQAGNRSFDFGTLAWWTDSPEKAKVLNKYLTSKKTVTLEEALRKLSKMIGKDDYVWANGTVWDFGALINAYNSFNIPLPWGYNKVRCMRVLRHIFGDSKETFVGNAHNAVDDCVHQTNYVISCLKKADELGLKV